mmetsp:Transcript_1086/g.2494  ORF Transcript_1086/g.2494 Transcript_1086/m.2494 type:complete len:346 (-) Transcript_1086:126-1163(-)
MEAPCRLQIRCSVAVILWACVALHGLLFVRATSSTSCPSDTNDKFAQPIEIKDGQTIYRQIGADETQLYDYSNTNITAIALPRDKRKVIFHLEPCYGVVYLFVKKSRLCHPNPYSCVADRDNANCESTHYVTELVGTHDGAPTFFEIPLSTTKYFISVYAREDSLYTLTVLADVGAYPRPGNTGVITSRQLTSQQLQVSWGAASFQPVGISSLEQYWLYVTMLLDGENQTSDAVVLRPTKVLNTVCGLANNTDRSYDRFTSEICSFGLCNATIDGVIPGRRYLVNVVAESARGYKIAYAGLITTADWNTVTQMTSDQTLKAIGAVSGSVLGVLMIVFFVVVRLYV